mgnify:CR=1 FL=1
MSARKDGLKHRKGAKRANGRHAKVVPQCKMGWSKMFQFLLDYPHGIARSHGENDFAGRTAYYYFTIRNGELMYDYQYDGEPPHFRETKGSCAGHDFIQLKWFEAYEPSCTCPQCVQVVHCCNCCRCKERNCEEQSLLDMSRKITEAKP